VLREIGFHVVPKQGWDSSANFVSLPTEEIAAQTYFEGASRLVAVNVYERSRSARATCIGFHGHGRLFADSIFQPFTVRSAKDLLMFIT
jgi:predicted HNH restriction endonuclease